MDFSSELFQILRYGFVRGCKAKVFKQKILKIIELLKKL